MKMILSAFHVAPIPALKTLADEGNEPLCMAALHNGNFMVGSWFTAENIENYRMMSEYLYFEYDTAYATKTWPLLPNFDDLTGWMRDVCLFQYVELVDVFRYMDYRVQISIKHSRDRQKSELKPFKVGDIESGLIIIGVGYFMAFVSFIFEFIFKYFERKRLVKRLAAKWKARVKHDRNAIFLK